MFHDRRLVRSQRAKSRPIPRSANNSACLPSPNDVVIQGCDEIIAKTSKNLRARVRALSRTILAESSLLTSQALCLPQENRRDLEVSLFASRSTFCKEQFNETPALSTVNSPLKNAVAGLCQPEVPEKLPASPRPSTVFQQAVNRRS